MAKKLGKFLLCAAAIGSAAAAAYLYLQKKDSACDTIEEVDTDYDDFSEEPEEAPSRNYVQLNKDTACKATEETAEETCAEEACAEEVCTEAAAEEPCAQENVAEAVFEETCTEEVCEASSEPEKVEEFFNEENA